MAYSFRKCEDDHEATLIKVEQFKFEPRADARAIVILGVAIVTETMDYHFRAPKLVVWASDPLVWILILFRVFFRALEQIGPQRVAHL